MNDTSALENLKYAHACDFALGLSSQEVHELWAEIDAQSKRIAELEAKLKVATQYEILVKLRAGEGTWMPLQEVKE